jgi:hypothetical protein
MLRGKAFFGAAAPLRRIVAQRRLFAIAQLAVPQLAISKSER